MRWLACALVGLPLALVPASAGEFEAGLLVGKPGAKGASAPFSVRPWAGAAEALDTGPMGFRFGWNPFDLKVASVWFTAAFQPKGAEDPSAGSPPGSRSSSEYVALGAQVDWTFLVNLHAGVDLRRERPAFTEVPPPSGSAGSPMNTRPWLKAGVGYTLPAPVLQPFLRLEVAWAVSREASQDALESPRKPLPPEYQVGLYGGIRF